MSLTAYRRAPLPCLIPGLADLLCVSRLPTETPTVGTTKSRCGWFHSSVHNDDGSLLYLSADGNRPLKTGIVAAGQIQTAGKYIPRRLVQS